MNRRVFTEYVRSLSAGEPVDSDLFGAVLGKLRDALIAEMKKRGLWNAPPTYLGIHGPESWNVPDALEELTADCFAAVLDRLPSLQAQLEVKDNVEGLLFRSIRNFLYDTQKKHDPLGFRVFVVAQTAVRQLIDGGTLHVLEGEPRVRNDTVVGFGSGVDAGQAQEANLGKHAELWNPELLPDLVTARGKKVNDVVTRLSARISGLPETGVVCFRIKDLTDALKNDVRRRWNAVWVHEQGETAFEQEEDGEDSYPVLVRLVRPDSGFEQRESFGKLVACVAEFLDRHEAGEKTRSYLERLWSFLRSHASEPEAPAAEAGASKLPSRREISRLLDIPRERLAGLLATLGELVQGCRAALADPRGYPARETAATG